MNQGHVLAVETAPASSRARAASSRYVWYVISLLSVVNVVNYMDRMALSVLMSYIKVDMALSDAQLGLLTGFAFAIFYAIGGLPIALWADRGIRRNIIALTLALWSVMTALCGAAQGFMQLMAARIGVGVGEAGSFPTTQSIMCDYVPLERRPGVFAILNFGSVVGTMSGMAFAGWLGETIGWRWTFVALGAPGVLLAIVVRVTLREPIRGFFEARKDSAKPPSLGATIRALSACRSYRLLLAYFVVHGFLSYGVYQWWPSFYVRLHGMNIAAAGVYLGLAIGLGSGVGMLGGGLIANKVARHDARLPFIVGAVAIVGALPAALAAMLVGSAGASIVLVSMTVLLLNVPNGSILSGLFSVVSSSMRAMAGAITIFLTSVLGFGLGPLFIGAVSDALSPQFGEQSLRYALIAPTCLIPLMIVLLTTAARTLRHDLAALNGSSDVEQCCVVPLKAAASTEV
jgi:predicted MFS family arabinose efflux permease